MKLNTVSFALAAGIVGALSYCLITVFALTGIPGFMPFAKLLLDGYGSYGYSISWLGALVGIILGFAEGFVWLGLFAIIYNKFVNKK